MTDLYRHFDCNGELLYVGISLSAFNRLRAHLKHQKWASEIISMTVEKHSSFETAIAAEKAAILSEKPKFNVTHGTYPRAAASSDSEYYGPNKRANAASTEKVSLLPTGTIAQIEKHEFGGRLRGLFEQCFLADAIQAGALPPGMSKAIELGMLDVYREDRAGFLKIVGDVLAEKSIEKEKLYKKFRDFFNLCGSFNRLWTRHEEDFTRFILTSARTELGSANPQNWPTDYAARVENFLTTNPFCTSSCKLKTDRDFPSGDARNSILDDEFASRLAMENCYNYGRSL